MTAMQPMYPLHNPRSVVVEGGSGAGKTTLVRYWNRRLAGRWQRQVQICPAAEIDYDQLISLMMRAVTSRLITAGNLDQLGQVERRSRLKAALAQLTLDGAMATIAKRLSLVNGVISLDGKRFDGGNIALPEYLPRLRELSEHPFVRSFACEAIQGWANSFNGMVFIAYPGISPFDPGLTIDLRVEPSIGARRKKCPQSVVTDRNDLCPPHNPQCADTDRHHTIITTGRDKLEVAQASLEAMRTRDRLGLPRVRDTPADATFRGRKQYR